MGVPREKARNNSWASLFASAASHILDLILLPARTARALANRLEPLLLHEAVDPNASRLLLLQRVDRGAAGPRNRSRMPGPAACRSLPA